MRAPRLFWGATGGLALLFFSCSGSGPQAPVGLHKSSAPGGYVELQNNDNIKFLGQEELVAQYSKPLPYRQYEVSRIPRPDLPSAVIFGQPETPYVDFKVKQPEDMERLLKWLAEWDSIQRQQDLAEAYRVSYLKTLKPNYLAQSTANQAQVVERLAVLQKNSWPNTDYAYKAFHGKAIACQKLELLNALHYYEGSKESITEPSCSEYP